MPTAPGMLGSSSFSRLRQDQTQRWQRLGVRENPFGYLPEDDQPEVLPHLIPLARQIPPLLAATGFAAVVIQAPRGWGKSTLLRVWRQELQRRGETFHQQALHPGDRLRPVPEVGWLLLDEAQRLSAADRRTVRRWLLRGERRLVATTHEDLRRWLPAKVVYWRLVAPGPEELRRWFARRIERFGGDPDRIYPTAAATCWLLRRWAGNLHDIQDFLYHLFATAPPRQLTPWDVPRGAASPVREGARRFVSPRGESTMG